MGANFPGRKICQSYDIIEWLSKKFFFSSTWTLLERLLNLKVKVQTVKGELLWEKEEGCGCQMTQLPSHSLATRFSTKMASGCGIQFEGLWEHPGPVVRTLSGTGVWSQEKGEGFSDSVFPSGKWHGFTKYFLNLFPVWRVCVTGEKSGWSGELLEIDF